MILNSLSLFSKEIEKEVPSLCLIVGKDVKEGVNLVLNSWTGRVKSFAGDDFSSSKFCSEVETLPLFSEHLICYISDIDKLKEQDQKVLLRYLKAPNKNISLLLSSATSFFVKEVQLQRGTVLQLVDEKIWQKKQRMEHWLKEKALLYGFAFSLEAIRYLIDCVGVEKDVLYQEFEKLITYTFHRRAIAIEDIRQLVSVRPSFTLWDLGEAIFCKNYATSWERGRALMEEGVSLFTILSQLRSQIRTLLKMSILYKQGGSSLLIQEFPYLKGAILSKKIEEIKGNSQIDLRRGLLFLFKTELKAKTMNADHFFLLELLLMKMQ